MRKLQSHHTKLTEQLSMRYAVLILTTGLTVKLDIELSTHEIVYLHDYSSYTIRRYINGFKMISSTNTSLSFLQRRNLYQNRESNAASLLPFPPRTALPEREIYTRTGKGSAASLLPVPPAQHSLKGKFIPE